MPVYGEDVSFLARVYPQNSREMIRDRIRDQLGDADRERVGGWLEGQGLMACFMS